MTIDTFVTPEQFPMIPAEVWEKAEALMIERLKAFIAENDVTVWHEGTRYTVINPDMEKITLSFSYNGRQKQP